MESIMGKSFTTDVSTQFHNKKNCLTLATATFRIGTKQKNDHAGRFFVLFNFISYARR